MTEIVKLVLESQIVKKLLKKGLILHELFLNMIFIWGSLFSPQLVINIPENKIFKKEDFINLDERTLIYWYHFVKKRFLLQFANLVLLTASKKKLLKE